VHGVHLADVARLEQLARRVVVRVRVVLDAHLRHGTRALGGARDETRFGDRARQRLLAVDVLAGRERGEHHRRVHVIGDRDVHRGG
jgi:hypothetical protein